MKEKTKNEKIYFCIRLFAIIISVLILIINSYLCIKDFKIDKNFALKNTYFRIAKTFAMELFFLYLIFKPYKFESIAVFSFIYIGINIYADPFNDSIIFMYFLALLSLYVRGFLKNHKIIKYLFFIIGLILIFFSNFRFGMTVFYEDIMNKLINTSICCLIFILYIFEKNRSLKKQSVLDLSEFKELTERDKEWIELALTQEKYDSIAHKYNLSPNYIKNRMRIIYKILDVPDRLSLISEYSGYIIKK